MKMLDEILAELPAARRKKVEVRAAELIAEHMDVTRARAGGAEPQIRSCLRTAE